MVRLSGQMVLILPPLCQISFYIHNARILAHVLGTTKVLVSINGPIEVQRRDELIQETTVDIQFRPVSGLASPHEKILELQLREFVQSVILKNLNPRSLVQIVVQVVSIDTEALNTVLQRRDYLY